VVGAVGRLWGGGGVEAHLLPCIFEAVEDVLGDSRAGGVGLYLRLCVHAILLDERAMSYCCLQIPHPKDKVNQRIKQFKRFKLIKSI
jgi:hypothetical protein